METLLEIIDVSQEIDTITLIIDKIIENELDL